MPDPFVSLVEAARQRLTALEGREVSVRELIRRARYEEKERAKTAYHLRNLARPRGHRVPHELVERLAPVLEPAGVTYDELRRAALEAGGYTVDEDVSGLSPDVLGVVTRYLDDPGVEAEDKDETTRRLLEAIARRMRRPPEE